MGFGIRVSLTVLRSRDVGWDAVSEGMGRTLQVHTCERMNESTSINSRISVGVSIAKQSSREFCLVILTP
jgi:hypothetical protein